MKDSLGLDLAAQDGDSYLADHDLTNPSVTSVGKSEPEQALVDCPGKALQDVFSPKVVLAGDFEK
jgi:hypothetical protein